MSLPQPSSSFSSSSSSPSRTPSSSSSSSNSGSSLSSFDITNLVLAILGGLAAIQQIYQYLFIRLPTQRLKALDEATEDATDLFQSVVGEGLFDDDPAYFEAIEKELNGILRRAETLRAQTHATIGFRAQFGGFWYGLSNQLVELSERAHGIRSKLGSNKRVEAAFWGSGAPSAATQSGSAILPEPVTTRHRRPRPASSTALPPPLLVSRHPSLGSYLLQDRRIFENLDSASSRLRQLPQAIDNNPQTMAVSVGQEQLQLSFTTNGVASHKSTAAVSAPPANSGTLQTTPGDEFTNDSELAHVWEAFQQEVKLLSEVAQSL